MTGETIQDDNGRGSGGHVEGSGRQVEGFLEENRKGRGLLGDEAVDDFAGLVGGGVWGGVEAGEARGADCEAAEAVV